MLAATTLDQVVHKRAAVVTALRNSGPERRRMMDLGILPGTRIEIAMTSPLGDPTAYYVRGAVIALRREQANQIEVNLVGHEDRPESAI